MQKLINGTDLYVFDLTPFEITQQTGDAEVIYVQNECIDGYKELNASLADKIKGFNQFVMCVTDPWANGVEPSPEPPTPITYTFSLSGYDIHSHVELYFDDVQQEVHTESYDVAAGASIKVVPTEDTSYYTLVSGAEWNSDLSAWVATMPEENYSIEINYSEPVPTGHTLTFDVQGIELCRITDELGSDTGRIDNPTSPVNVEVGKYFKMFTNGYGNDHYEYYTITGVQATFVDSANSYNSYPFFYFVMPDEDVTFSVTYEEPTYAEVEVTYDVQDTESEIELFSAGGGSPYEGTPTPPDEMYVDDIQETVVNSWRFGTTGDHTVKFVFQSGRVSTGFMQNNPTAKSINLNGQVTQIGENAFNISTPSITSITSLAATPPTLEGSGDNQFANVPIYVDADYVTDYQTAWSNFALQIQAMQS